MTTQNPTKQEVTGWANRLRDATNGDETKRNVAEGAIRAFGDSIDSGGGGIGFDPPIIPANMRIREYDYAAPYPNGMGAPFGVVVQGDRSMTAGNKENGDLIIDLNVRSLRFVMPANKRLAFWIGPQANVQVICVSPYKGDFRGIIPNSRQNGGNKPFLMSSRPGDAYGMALEGGNEYYMNFVLCALALSDPNAGIFVPSRNATTGVSNSGCAAGLPACNKFFWLQLQSVS